MNSRKSPTLDRPDSASPNLDFVRAILVGDMEQVEHFLAEGEPADQMLPYNRCVLSPLHISCITGQAAVAERLLRSGAAVNRQSSIGESPLFVASAYGHDDVVEALVRVRANVDLRQHIGCSPLWIAAQNGHHQVIRRLLEAQADVNLARTGNGSTPLYIASQNGHHKVVRELLADLASVDQCKSDGCSALHIAALRGHNAVVEELIKAQADLDLQQDRGRTAVYAASQEGHLDVVRALVKAGADVDLCQIQGASPIFIASQFGWHEIVESMTVESFPNVNLTTLGGATPLYIAAQEGHHRVIERLVRALADVDSAAHDGHTPLHIASQNGHAQAVKALFRAQVDLNRLSSKGFTPLYMAASFGHHDIVAMLLATGADPNLSGMSAPSPLYVACQNDHHHVALALIAAQADVNQAGRLDSTPMYVAAQQSHSQIVEALLRAQADPDAQMYQGASPLHMACQTGHQRVVDSLIAAGADVSLTVSDGTTPLHLAARAGHWQIVRSLLCVAMTDVDSQNPLHPSPLYIAAQNGNADVVKAIICANACVDLQTLDGTSPLWIAAQNGHSETVDLLIRAQTNVNAQREDGYSPLHIACHCGHETILVSLLRAQADVELPACNGASPLYSASQNGHLEVVKMLIKAQANVNVTRTAGDTPLSIASQLGHHRVVDALIQAQADLWTAGDSPLSIASRLGHHRVVDALIRAQADLIAEISPLVAAARFGQMQMAKLLQTLGTSPRFDRLQPLKELMSQRFSKPRIDTFNDCARIQEADEFVSWQLHSAFSGAGFVDSRAALQSSVADVLQSILRWRTRCDIFIVGSFSEGWGNSLMTLDGRTDLESDIDIVNLIAGRQYHLSDHCRCDSVDLQRMQYCNGHISHHGSVSNPIRSVRVSTLRPAVDQVNVIRCCCYPPIAPLLPDRVSKSNIPQSVLQSLKQELRTSPCHVVHAAPPGQAGTQLRVSTTFLEKQLLRSLSTLQGQLFVLLKYLVKKVISHKLGFNVQGLRTYHAKTITFRMLEVTPAEQWQPKYLVDLTRRSLQMLLDSVVSSLDNADGRIMDNFFLHDVGVYLNCAGHGKAQQIARVLTAALDQLPQLLMQFKESLEPVSDAGTFYFHPYLILPNLNASHNIKPELDTMKYHEIYDAVRESLLQLSHLDESAESSEIIIRRIDRLPDCARTAREALRALACLKFGNRDAATKVLSDCIGHEVSRGIAWSAGRSRAEATADFVWQHLRSCDSAWKFCFEYAKPPKLNFLCGLPSDCFHRCAEISDTNYCYMNFSALLLGLQLEMKIDKVKANARIRNATMHEDVDAQELMTCMRYYNSDSSLTARLPNESRFWRSLDEGVAGDELLDVQLNPDCFGFNEWRPVFVEVGT